MAPYTPSGLLEYRDSNWVVNDYTQLNDMPGLLSWYKITAVPTIPTNFNQLGGTIPYSSISNTPAAATFSSLHPVDTWLSSSDNSNRVYYSNAGSSWYKCGGTDNSHIFINSADTAICRMKHNGFVGIGLDPSAILHVGTGTTNSGQLYFDYFNNQAYNHGLATLSDACAIFESSLWCKSWIASSSDIRIKKNIEDINDDSALQKILEIQPKTYKYIDVVSKGDKKVYGFIAQQINEVLPEAVAIEKDIIPNIYKVCDCSLNKIYVVDCTASIDTKIDIIDASGNRKPYIITEITENYITIDKEIIGDKCFVYGYEVNDFHTIDKSYIFTLNVCATQELHRKITTLEEQIEAQEVRILELERKINIL